MSTPKAWLGLSRLMLATVIAAAYAPASVRADDPPATVTSDEIAEEADGSTPLSKKQPEDRTAAPNVADGSEVVLMPTEPTYGPEPEFEAEATSRSFPNVPLLTTSAMAFTIAYVPAVIGGAVSDRNDDDLYIPVAGPWMTLANDPSETTGQKVLLVVNGAVQGIGALGMLASFFVPQTRTKNWYTIGKSDVQLTPSMLGTYGLTASGRF